MAEQARAHATPAEAALAYHERSKHRLERYAAGPETLDWTAQPDPFREYAGAPRVALPLAGARLTTRHTDLYAPGRVAPQPLALDALGALLELSFGLSAWKEYGPDRWALRCNPSSGNLHPTEAYVIGHGVDGLEDGVYHYVSRDHVLERRGPAPVLSDGPALYVALSSIHWREAWKYGERAFRYCQHDVGHALGALRYAAAALGWSARLCAGGDGARLAAWLGLERAADYAGAEREEPDLMVALAPDAARADAAGERLAQAAPGEGPWTGRANVLDPHPMYRWPVIDEVAAATHLPPLTLELHARESYPPLSPRADHSAADLIRQRRSAQRFDGRSVMPADDFFRLLDCLLVRPLAPWDVWDFAPHIHLVLLVHRVEGIEPGLYVLARSAPGEKKLRAALHREFLWKRVAGAPAHLPLFQLLSGDARQAARAVCCHQAIAADGCFAVGMLAEFDALVHQSAWRYRQLHWEAGLLGQALYLEAEAAGLRGTGIGCFFDDAFHELLGLKDHSLQTLYHFTVGHALSDARITTLPPYPERLEKT